MRSYGVPLWWNRKYVAPRKCSVLGEQKRRIRWFMLDLLSRIGRKRRDQATVCGTLEKESTRLLHDLVEGVIFTCFFPSAKSPLMHSFSTIKGVKSSRLSPYGVLFAGDEKADRK